jgi:hypothetical protein
MPSRLEIRDGHLSLGTATTVNKIFPTTGKFAEPTVLRVAQNYNPSTITSPNSVDSNQKSYEITQMKISVTQYMTRTTKAEVKLTTFRVTKLHITA